MILLFAHQQGAATNLPNFLDDVNGEYKFGKCNQKSNLGEYLLDLGLNYQTDIDSYYSLFERMSVIYISRNLGNVIFEGNKFLSNIGTFGGAISINSPYSTPTQKSYLVFS